ncbi:drug/metabolite transporter (DMT)-like permease [Pseudarthrobacter oxydans]|uniref:hypothetical protein n=1 Tax=Pseudarthrobacter oxydans TaxID=1671 RepID=UPI0027845CFB|nr:hypothetical protein [Pseudarthrobacter oxydans]MDP9983845.1 drug/metabolite transporter (DMT)-like permease [Pseudarthrobacter oxydans]
MLISINALFLLLVCLLVAGVVWVALDRLLRRRIEEGRGRAIIVRNAGIAALVSGLMVGISLLQAILEPARTALFTPYLMALGVLAATWCVRLRRLGLFWGTANYAQALGRRLAVNFEQGVQYMRGRRSIHSSRWASARRPSKR